MIYRCRWQVELLFKELKSETNWRRFATGQKAIMEGLVWTSLLALIIRRYIAMQSMSSVSLYKAGKNVDTEPQQRGSCVVYGEEDVNIVPFAFLALKVLGGLYLCYIAYKTLRDARLLMNHELNTEISKMTLRKTISFGLLT